MRFKLSVQKGEKNMFTDDNEKKIVSNEDSEKRTYTVQEIAAILQIGRSKAYQLCNDGLFSIIRIGKTVRISKASFDEWFKNH